MDNTDSDVTINSVSVSILTLEESIAPISNKVEDLLKEIEDLEFNMKIEIQKRKNEISLLKEKRKGIIDAINKFSHKRNELIYCIGD